MKKFDPFAVAGPAALLLFAIAVSGFAIIILLAGDQSGLQLLAAAALVGAILQGSREIRWLYRGNMPGQKVVHYDHFQSQPDPDTGRITVSCYRQAKPEQTVSCLSQATCDFCREIGARQAAFDQTEQGIQIPPPTG